MTSQPHATASSRPSAARAVAAGVMVAEALVLIGFCAFYIIEVVGGATDDLSRAATSGLLILVFAVLLLVVARGWRRGTDWPRTPTLLWNVLLLPVAWSLHGSGRTLVALGVSVLAVVGIGAALAVPPGHPTGHSDTGDTGDGGEDDGAGRPDGGRVS